MSVATKKKKDAHLWARDPDDWYVEPGWTSARLFEREQFPEPILDPACGMGRIVESAHAKGYAIEGTDLVDRASCCSRVEDFLTVPSFHTYNGGGKFASIVCNPPFKHAQAFVSRALDVATSKVAMLLPQNWFFGQERSRWLQDTPLYRIYALTPRPSMPPGAVIAAGEKPGGGEDDFAWFVWLQGYRGEPTFNWIDRDEG